MPSPSFYHMRTQGDWVWKNLPVVAVLGKVKQATQRNPISITKKKEGGREEQTLARMV